MPIVVSSLVTAGHYWLYAAKEMGGVQSIRYQQYSLIKRLLLASRVLVSKILSRHVFRFPPELARFQVAIVKKQRLTGAFS